VADPTARQWFVNQGTFTLVGAALVDVVAEQAGANAGFAVVSTDPGAFSQNSWIAAMKAQMQAKYPKMQLLDIRYGLGKPAESFSMTQDLIIDLCISNRHEDHKKRGRSEPVMNERMRSGRLFTFLVMRHRLVMRSSRVSGWPLASSALKWAQTHSSGLSSGA